MAKILKTEEVALNVELLVEPLRREDRERDIVLSPQDAKAGGPAGESVTGEEDPGAGLEFLVRPVDHS